MALTSPSGKEVTLKGVNWGGLIREDVMNKIWDISKIPLPFTDSISSDKAKQSYTEWTLDELQAVDVDNSYTEGQDSGWNDDTAAGERVGNHCQISAKHVPVSERASNSDTIGRSNELAYQVMRRQQELRRDVEAISLEPQASLADDGAGTAKGDGGKAGGFPTWIDDNFISVGGGTAGGYNLTTGLTEAQTPGTRAALTETAVKDAIEAVYNKGGNPTKMMSVPAVIRKFSEYLFTSSARVGTITSDQGKSEAKATALGAVNVFVSDFGTLTLVPNRIQQYYEDVGTDDAANVFVYDPEYVRHAFLDGYQTQSLAKTGLMDKRLMSVDWTLKVLNPDAHALIADVDPTADVTA